MPFVATVLGLLTAVAFLAVAARRLGIPYPTLMVLCGLVIAIVPGLPTVKLDPEIIFIIFLPPLLYSAAWTTSWQDFRANLRPISLLAVGLVLATTTAVAVARAVGGFPEIPWAAAFVLGALVSPPDAVAAAAVTKGLGVPRRVIAILEGESLVNDATGLVAYRIAVAAALGGFFSIWEAAGQFVIVSVGGLGIGLLGGWLVAQVHKHLEDPIVETVITLMTPYAVYLPAETCGVSGVLATVTAGIYMSRRSPVLFSSAMRLQATAVWDVVIFILTGVTFILIGLQLPDILREAKEEDSDVIAELACLTCLVVVAVRFLWVYPAAYLPRLLSARLRARDPMPAFNQLTVIGWAGMRGVVSLAAALALPLASPDGTQFPKRNLVIVVTFGVILFTLVVQSLTLPLLIRWLRVSSSAPRRVTEEAEARLAVLSAAFTFLDEAAVSQDQDLHGLDTLREQFINQRSQMESRLATARTTMIRAATVCKQLYAGALTAQRRRLLHLWRSGEYHDELLQQIQREIDLEEARLSLYPDVMPTGRAARVPLRHPGD